MSAAEKKTFLTRKEFVEIAIKFELDSAGFYNDMKSRVAGDESLVDLMDKLAEQETGHARTLQAYTAPEDDVATMQFGPDLTMSMPTTPADLTLEGMLNLAIERESKTAQIYHAAADRATGEFRDMIEGLAGFEEEHQDRLQRLKASYGEKTQSDSPGTPHGASQPIYTKLARPESAADDAGKN